MKQKLQITICFLFILLIVQIESNAQTTIYSTDFGTIDNVNPIGWTFTGVDMNISSNNASSGYSGVSGGAYLGEGNSVAFVNTSGNSQAASQIGTSTATLLVNTTNYNNITVSFGMRKSSASYNTNATYVFEWSTDNITYTPISYTEATAGNWGLASGAGLTLPSGAANQATVYLRWTFNRTGTGSNFKMDDFKVTGQSVNSSITLSNDFINYHSAAIGTYHGINFREAGFSSLYAIPNTNNKDFWTISDRGVNIDDANANPIGCHPTYDKMYAFPNYAPKIHRIRLNGDSIQILQTITMKRPNGTTATGIINPTGYGSTAAEVASTDTVLNCANFNSKIAAKDIWGIDSEGIIVDKDGNFWICEEGGPTIWKLNQNGVVIKRFTPYANLPNAQAQDILIDTVFKYRKNNRGFEGISITPNGKIYAIIQSPILYPNIAVGEASRVHRILEINPVDNSTRMFVYLNEGVIGTGGNQIRLKDWKIGEMAAINNNEFLVLEAAARGTTDIKRIYKIDISGATTVNSGLYGGVTLEALVNATTNDLTANNIVPVAKTLFLDLLANGWPAVLDKAEGLAIINDSTIVVCNDNDYGQTCPLADGIGVATNTLSHVIKFELKGLNKISGFQPAPPITIASVFDHSTSFSSKVIVFPNPANDLVSVSINLDKPERVTAAIYDMKGNEVIKSAENNFTKGTQQIDLNTSDLENGIYFIHIISNSGVAKVKILVLH